MPEDGRRVELNSTTYVTRVNGKLVVVRKRPKKTCDIALDSPGEGLCCHPCAKSNKIPETPSRKSAPPPAPRAKDSPGSPSPSPPLSPPTTLVSAKNPQTEAVMNSLPLNVPIYQKGKRQLALVPVNSQGGSALLQNPSQQQAHQFPPFSSYQFPPFNPQPPPWMIPGGYMCLPMDSSGIQVVSGLVPDSGVTPLPQVMPSSITSNEALLQPQAISIPIPNTEPVPHTQPVPSSMPNAETPHQTVITISRHVCGQCGRQRSPKYHQEHPIIPGETPVTAFCRKCCKDETSSAESKISTRKSIGKHRDKNENKLKKKGTGSYRKNDSDNDSISPKKAISFGRSERSSNAKKTRPATTENGSSLEGHQRRATYQGFGAQLQDVVGYLRGHERSSPLFDQKRQISPSNSKQRYPKETIQTRKASSRKAKTSVTASSESNNAREVYVREPSSLPRPKTLQTSQDLHVPGSWYGDHRSRRVIRDEQGSFEESHSEKSTSVPEQSARRRRTERSLSGGAAPQVTDNTLRDKLLSEGNEVIVVTEHYVRRPKKAYSFEEEVIFDPSQQQIENNAVTSRQLLTESEALYSFDNRSRQSRRDRQNHQLLRRNVLSDRSSYSYDSDVSLDSQSEDISLHSTLPLGATARSLAQNQRTMSPHRPTGSKPVLRRSREVLLSDSEQDHRGRSQHSAESSHRPPYVRDASDMGTERAIISSPRPSREYHIYSEDFPVGTRHLDQAERHVAFKELDDDYVSHGSRSTLAHSFKEATTRYRGK